MAQLVSGPAVEPVTVAEQKAFSRVEYADDDNIIVGVLKAARECVENATNRRLITQTWRHYPANPRDIILPFGPVQAVTSVTLYDETGSAHLLAPSDYDADIISEPATLKVRNLQGVSLRWTNPLAVEFVCGYGDSGTTVPESIRQAIMLLAAHWYENRVAVAETALRFEELPMGVKYLLAPYRLWGRQL